MRQIGQITRVGPDRRVETLMRFRRRLADNTDVSLEISTAYLFGQIIKINFYPNRFKESSTAGGSSFPTILFNARRGF